MNAVNTLAREQVEADVAARIAAADKWLDTARPIIVAYFKLDELDFEIRRDMPEGAGNERTAKEACGSVTKARRELFDLLDGIRSDFIADQTPPQPVGDGDAAWDAFEAISEPLNAETVSVAGAIKRVEQEWNDAFAKGRPL